jgi:hypothetical protein
MNVLLVSAEKFCLTVVATGALVSGLKYFNFRQAQGVSTLNFAVVSAVMSAAQTAFERLHASYWGKEAIERDRNGFLAQNDKIQIVFIGLRCASNIALNIVSVQKAVASFFLITGVTIISNIMGNWIKQKLLIAREAFNNSKPLLEEIEKNLKAMDDSQQKKIDRLFEPSFVEKAIQNYLNPILISK